MKHWKRLICGLLLLGLSVQLAACASAPEAPQAPSEPTETHDPVSDADAAVAAADFSVALLRSTDMENKTCIISPYSVLIAMAMTANGAGGNTLAQIEAAFGMPISELNRWLSSVCAHGGSEVVGANSIWLRQTDGFELSEEFVKTNESSYGAQIVPAPFDGQTLADINNWVSEHTHERIPTILDSLDQTDMMVLLSALTFDAAWQSPYTDSELIEGRFTAADGTVQTVTMMRGEENLFLDDGKATGFLKSYEGERYSYVALLPNEGVSMEEYIGSLSGKALLELIDSASVQPIRTQMPAYQAETSTDMAKALQAMGITEAFASGADFSRLGNGALNIQQVLHKTYMKVHSGGTEAAAATAVVMEKSASVKKQKEIILNRPYVMAIVDRQQDVILFLGVVNSVG